MLTERIIGALTFRRGVYAEVEADKTFTATAWILVVIFALLNQLGSYASQSIFNWLVGTGIGVLTAIGGFAIAAVVISWVGRRIFSAKVSFGELVRTMGLASIWTVVGVLGVIATFSDALSCILGPVIVISWVALVVAWFVAVHEALDLTWGKTIITVIIGFIPWAIILSLTGVVLSLLDLTATGFGSLFGL
ncbi:MAG TPA: YIP1 family protein [Anaerolineales bacterium]|nr:YIP1 family protein [Anaerolineales bacterium]